MALREDMSDYESKAGYYICIQQCIHSAEVFSSQEKLVRILHREFTEKIVDQIGESHRFVTVLRTHGRNFDVDPLRILSAHEYRSFLVKCAQTEVEHSTEQDKKIANNHWNFKRP